MGDKFSAYLSIYNDWDILPSALRSVASHIDELVVVDGAYDWMIPYLTMLGLDSARSDPRVYAAIEESGIPFRVISRTWKNEIEKRQTGYEACAHDFIYRIDADEIMFFDDRALETALSCGFAVGEMQMPIYVAPGWISCARDILDIERQCFLFDRQKVSSEVHLNYLWLILTADTLPLAGTKPFQVYPDPLAFNAHLTGWRTPRTSVSRAAFYVLNWMRQYGVPWLPGLRGRPLANLQDLFDIVPPSAFFSSLRMGPIGVGMTDSVDKRILRPTTLGPEQEATFTDLYDNFVGSLAERNTEIATEEQRFLTCLPVLMDLSTHAARNAIAPNGSATLRMSMPLLSANVRLLTYATSEPCIEVQTLSASLSGRDLRIELPDMPQGERRLLRQCLEFHVWLDSQVLPQRFQALT
jgi:hypothetical protein